MVAKKKTTKKKVARRKRLTPEQKIESGFKELFTRGCKEGEHKHKCSSHHCDTVYWMGFLGAVIYYISNATGFWNGCLGILKAFLWPAFLIFEVLTKLGM